MAYKLTVRFRGLLLWVPCTDLSKDQRWFGAFLPNADQTTLAGLGNDPRLNLHIPCVRFCLSALTGAPPDNDGQGIWPLYLEDVVIRPQSSLGGPLQVIQGGPIGTVPTNGQEQFFNWVPSLNDLIGDGSIYPDCLMDAPQDGMVVARVHLTEGLLYTDSLSIFANSYVREAFVPVQGAKRLERVIAVGVALDMNGLSGDLTIRTRSYGRKNPGAMRSLTFAEPTNGQLTIDVVNLCAAELAGPRPQLPGIDEDFRLNYLLSAPGNQRVLLHQPLPIPVATQFDPGDDGGGEFARCTHPQADPIAVAQTDALLKIANGI